MGMGGGGCWINGHPAGIHCDFANDRLHTVTIFQTTKAAFFSKIVDVLTVKYGAPYTTTILGNEMTSFHNEENGNKTRIRHGTDKTLWGSGICFTEYAYDCDTAKLVRKAFEEEKRNALKDKANNSDL